MMEILETARSCVSGAKRPTFVRLLIPIVLAASTNVLGASTSNDVEGSCASVDTRLRSGYLIRSLIESRHALTILKRIDDGDVEAARSLAIEIIKGGRVEIVALLDQCATDADERSARKAIDEIDSYLDALK